MKAFFNKTIFYGVLIAVLNTSCTNNEEEKAASNGDKVAVRISASVQTRAIDNVWNENDAIGISMMKPETNAVMEPYRNYAYTTSGDGNFSPKSADRIMYFPENGSSVSFKAYYPYKKDLSVSQVIPISVQDQTSLPDIDLMTAEHTAGNSIDDPNVQLHFYHRLSKAIIDLTTDDTGLINLKDCKLSIKGLKTAGIYDLLNEKLTVDAQSDNDINIPIHNAGGNAILLPRPAGEGVIFEVTTANGGTYTAVMADDLELKAGYKYTFHIRLKSTPVKVSATIEPWAEGPERYTDVVRIVTGLKDSRDFQANDTLRLFLKDKGETDFSYLSTFTYGNDGTWKANKPIYWEDITADPAAFRGATIIADRLNNSQMPDILVSKDINVAQYTGVNLEMGHAGSKATIKLKSSDGTFTSNDFKNASITLPAYLNNGYINDKGEFIIGNTTTDIIPKDGVTIFPPQTIASGENLVVITINGRDYNIKVTEPGGFQYAPGTAYTLTADLSKSKIQISSVITPWTEETHEFQDVRIGNASLNANGGDIQNGDQLYLYSGNNTDRIGLNGYFTYNSSTWNYNDPSTPLYWEDIPQTGYIYASITRPAISDASGNNQSKDYITATPVGNDGGVTNTAINFTLSHQVAKVLVTLKSTTNTYTAAQLQSANITLPNYQIGGSLNNGLYKPGSSIGTITLDTPDVTSNTTSTYLQPQTITTNSTIAVIELEGRRYVVTDNSNLEYKAGVATHLIIDIKATELKVSANVIGWTEEIHNLALSFTSTSASASGFENNDQIKFYKLGTDGSSVTNDNATYKYIGDTNSGSLTPVSATWYRDDFQTGEKITAIFPSVVSNLTSGNSTFSWSCKSSGTTNEHQDDVMVAAPSNNNGIIAAGSANVSLNFKHALSKVTVNLFNGDGFTSADISPSIIKLVNFKLAGTVNVVNGTATATGSATPSFPPTKLTTPNTVQGKGTAVNSYEAFIMPQVIGTIGSKTSIITVTLNGQTYNAEIELYDFKAGENHVFNITLKKTGLLFSATVAPWENGTGGSITIL